MQIGRRRHDGADHRVEALEQLAPLRPQPRAPAVGDQPVAMAERDAAQAFGAEAHIVGREFCGRRQRAGIDIRLKATRRETTAASAYRAATRRRSRAVAGSGGSRSTPALARLAASFSIAARTTLTVGMTGSVSISSTRKFFRSRRGAAAGSASLIAVAGFQRIGPGHHVEQQRQIGGAARHRPDHGEIAVERQWRQRRRRMAARRHQAKVGLCA